MGGGHHHGARSQRAAANAARRGHRHRVQAEQRARLTLRWRGGSLTDIDLDLPRQKPAIVRTDVSTWRPDTSPPATRARAHARPEAPPKIKG
jgi:hypothetical protein